MATSAAGARPRVFLDSSLVIAAAISAAGSARDLINLGLDGTVDLVISSLVLSEAQRNIARKVPRALPVFQLIRGSLQRRVIDPPPETVAIVARVVEPKDAPIVAAALAARAVYLASYDRKHLLNQAARIESAYNLTIATPDQIVSRLTGGP